MSMLKKEDLYSSGGVPYTKNIFADFGYSESSKFYLESNLNKKPLPVLRELYVAMTVDDPTEVAFVEAVFDGDFSWWFRLNKVAWFAKMKADWVKEAEVKRKAKAFETIVQEATSGGRGAVQAARYLIDEPWKSKDKQTQKTKKETTQQAAKTAAVPTHIQALQKYKEEKNG